MSCFMGMPRGRVCSNNKFLERMSPSKQNVTVEKTNKPDA